MKRKQRIEQFLEVMEQKYQPHTGLRQSLYESLDPKISDDQFEDLLKTAKGCYQRNQLKSQYIQRAREAIQEISENISKMGELYGEQMKGLVTIVGSFAKYAGELPKAATNLETAVGDLKGIIRIQDKNLKILKDTADTLDTAIWKIKLKKNPPKASA